MSALKPTFLILVVSLFSFCGNAPEVLNVNKSSLEFNILFPDNQNLQKTKETTFDSLVIEIFESDNLLLRESTPISPNAIVYKKSLNNISAGKSRRFNIYTVNNSGQVIHVDSEKNRTIDIDPNTKISIIVTMIPTAGSVYLQLGTIPTNVDSIFVKFTALNGAIWETRSKRDTKLFISLDNIPDGTNGLIEITEVNNLGDTLFYSSKNFTIDVKNSTFLNLNLSATPGQIEISATVVKPEVTVISIGNDILKPAEVESGELLITEIMYIANNNEYIEIFNTKNIEVAFESLLLQIDTKTYKFSNITINPYGYYVLGKTTESWINQSNSSIDLTGNGNWITLKTNDSTIIDQVIFTEKNGFEWPKPTAKQSIVLNGNYYSATLNNLGRNWSLVEIDPLNLLTSTQNVEMYGTPGR